MVNFKWLGISLMAAGVAAVFCSNAAAEVTREVTFRNGVDGFNGIQDANPISGPDAFTGAGSDWTQAATGSRIWIDVTVRNNMGEALAAVKFDDIFTNNPNDTDKILRGATINSATIKYFFSEGLPLDPNGTAGFVYLTPLHRSWEEGTVTFAHLFGGGKAQSYNTSIPRDDWIQGQAMPDSIDRGPSSNSTSEVWDWQQGPPAAVYLGQDTERNQPENTPAIEREQPLLIGRHVNLQDQIAGCAAGRSMPESAAPA